MTTYAFIGLGTLTGSWDPGTNSGSLNSGFDLANTGSATNAGNNIMAHSTSLGDSSLEYNDARRSSDSKHGGYHASSNLTASVGDYWEVTSNATFTLDQNRTFTELDWCIWDGSEWKRISNSDKIGTVVVGNVGAALEVVTNDLDIEGGLNVNTTDGDNDFTVSALGVEKALWVDASANCVVFGTGSTKVGIGVASPSEELEIDGDLKFSPTTISTAHITSAGSLTVRADANMTIGDSTVDSIRIGRTNTALVPIYLRSGGDYNLVVSNNRVGIGDDSPDALLDLQGASDTGVPTLIVDHDDTDQIAISVAAANIDANVIDITADAVQDARVINISADALTTGAALYIDDDSSNTGTRSTVSIIQNNAAATGATALTLQSDGGNIGMTLDKNASGDAAQDAIGLKLDFDRTVASSGTAAHNDIGIDLDVNSRSLGTSTVTGMDIDVVGHTDGTHTAYGIDLDVDSADTNIGIQINTAGTHLKLIANADADDYATIAVADTGDLTITTVGDGTTDSDITLDADGDIILKPDGGDVLPDGDATRNFGSASKRWANIYTGDLHLKNERGDWTIIEEEHELTIRNNKTNKMYRFKLEEIED